MNKLIRDGNVAVLVSGGYGAGFSTWCYDVEGIEFEPTVAQMVLDEVDNEEILEYLDKTYPDNYWGGIDGLYVHWVPEGTKFVIEEYDGSESLMTPDDYDWRVA
jgi:hypothetical protein